MFVIVFKSTQEARTRTDLGSTTLDKLNYLKHIHHFIKWRIFSIKSICIHHTVALTLVTRKQLTRNIESADCEMWRQQPADQNTGDYYMQQPRSGARPSCILRLLYWAFAFWLTLFTDSQTILYERLNENVKELSQPWIIHFIQSVLRVLYNLWTI